MHGRRSLSSGIVALLALVLFLAARGAWAHGGPPLPGDGGAPEETPGLESILDLVRGQKKVIDRQEKTIGALEKRLAEVESLALSSHNRLEEMGERTPDIEVSEAVEERLAELESSIEELPERADIVAAGEFPGSFRIPGTDAAIKIGGQVRFTGVSSLNAIGSEDRFVTSSIPIAGTEEAGKESRVTYIASPSRLNFDMRTPTGVGSMRAFIEADYGGPSNSFRLRHAFGQWQKFLIGQTWSTFADPEAEPDGIDFEGLNAISLFRKPQIRWTTPFGKANSVSLALENPAPDVTGAAGLNQVPDIIARVRWEPERMRGPLRLAQGIGHVQVGAIVRQVRAEPADAPNTTVSTGGFGFNVSGRMKPAFWNDEDGLTWAAYAGKGIGSYITDLRTLGGQDGVYDSLTNTVEALPVAAAYMGYQHWWNDTMRSTATFGWVYVDNLDVQRDDALHQTVRYSVNLSWSPIPRLDLVGEFLSGRRLNKNGDRGHRPPVPVRDPIPVLMACLWDGQFSPFHGRAHRGHLTFGPFPSALRRSRVAPSTVGPSIPRGYAMSVKHVVALLAGLAVTGAVACTEKAPERRVSRAALEDKVRGGWAGQMIGVAFGAPTEFKSNGKIIEGELEWTPEMISNTIQQDDLYVEMTFAEVMDTVGLDATTEQYGEMFRDSEYHLWHANAGARRNLNRGIKAPLSGHPDYNIHANDIDFQIESDFIGLMTPGLPQEANKYADRVGRVMNYGDGLYGGMFVSGMYAAGFFETDPRKVVEEGLKSIPAGSGYAQVIADVLGWHEEHPTDWKTTWTLLEEKWDGDDMCPDGGLTPFNIDARLNGAYIVLGLLYGEGDFRKTLEISTRAGQDSDCNPSSAAGVLGVMRGYEAIPEEFKAGIPALEDEKFAYTQYSFNEIVDSTVKRAETIIEGVGGRVTDAEVVIPLQAPAAPPLEQWKADPPIRRVELDDPAWEWGGDWKAESFEKPWGQWTVKKTTQAGAEASFTFEGTGVAVVGGMTQEGGRADVFLDGEKSEYHLDAWIPERTHDNDYWHVTGLAPGEHTLRIVVREDADERSTGNLIQIQNALVYGKKVQ